MGCPNRVYNTISAGSIDLLALQRRVAVLEEQSESYEQLIAEMMLTIKSLTSNKPQHGSAE